MRKGKLTYVQQQPFLDIRRGGEKLTQNKNGLSAHARISGVIVGSRPFGAKVVICCKAFSYIVCAFASEHDVLKAGWSRLTDNSVDDFIR